MSDKIILEDDIFSIRTISENCSAVDDSSECGEAFGKLTKLVKEERISPYRESIKTSTSLYESPLDFVRTFLRQNEFMETLVCLQNECAFKEVREKPSPPSEFVENQNLKNSIELLQKNLLELRLENNKLQNKFVKAKKERDFHALKHRLVEQEKQQLAEDIKLSKEHYEAYRPLLEKLSSKYEIMMREKSTTELNRAKAECKVSKLKIQLREMEAQSIGSPITKKTDIDVEDSEPKFLMDIPFPEDEGINPYLKIFEEKTPIRPYDVCLATSMQASNELRSESPVNHVTFSHQREMIIAGADDGNLKFFSSSNFSFESSIHAHTTWISSCQFNIDESRVLSSDADGLVKVWKINDFNHVEYLDVIEEHKNVVWDCAWHSCGDFIATASSDGMAKIVDLHTKKCRSILRYHKNSVNSVEFLPFSSTVLTASADKTVVLWDGRTSIKEKILVEGHMCAVNGASFTARGDKILSCDSFGALLVWDIRTMKILKSFNLGPFSANSLSIDSTGQLCAVGGEDSIVRMVELASDKTVALTGHEGPVNSVYLDKFTDLLVSGGGDGTVKIWT